MRLPMACFTAFDSATVSGGGPVFMARPADPDWQRTSLAGAMASLRSRTD